MASSIELAEKWLRLDQDPETRAEIQQLLDEQNEKELEKRLSTYITFGTAGLRARMEAGFSRLNSLTIIQATQGFAEYLRENTDSTAPRTVVIGRDARYNSEKFAKLTAAVFLKKGFHVHYYPVPVHTPLVPFGVNYFKAVAGVMITASHNPKDDNGYKVYWSNGCQIISPHDKGIAEAISKNQDPVTWDVDAISKDEFAHPICNTSSLESVKEAYFNLVNASANKTVLPKDLSFVYTPMHGVGLPYMKAAVGPDCAISIVKEQAEPDPAFPTVQFPNPEEKGALDLAIRTANEGQSSLIIATDPDADRMAAAEKVDGKWYPFTGNELGILLASYIFANYKKSNPADLQKLSMLATTVSSQMLKRMANQEGFHYEETLTGFKWLGNRALDLETQGYDVRFAFEQAIGYMIPSVVHDKDGVAASRTFLSACVSWREQGLTPYSHLQGLYKTYGYFADADTYVRSPSPADTTAAFARIRALGKPYPTQLATSGRRILSWRDLTTGYDSTTSDNNPRLPIDPATEMITAEVEGDVRFTVRGSGTEPKIKLYVEGTGASHEEAKKKALDVVAEIKAEWLPGFQGE